MKKLNLILIILGIVILNQKSFANDNKNVTGTWKVAVTDAPNQYVNSSFIVSEVNGGLTGKVVFEDGQELKVPDIQFSKDIIQFIVNIEGSDIKVSGKVENSKITGKVEAPDGVLDMIAVREQ